MVRWATVAAIAVVVLLIVSFSATLSDVRAAAPRGSSVSFEVAPATIPGRSASPAPSVIPDISAYTTILPNGTIVGASAPITPNGNTYDITAAFSGAIIDERNHSTLDGNGYTLTSVFALGFAVEVNTTTGVTVEDLTIVDEAHGVEVYNATSTTVTDVSAGTTSGAGFVALDSDAVTFSFDGANASGFGFEANDSLAVTYSHDYASNDVDGFYNIFDTGIDGTALTATDDGYAFLGLASESVSLFASSFLSATEVAVDLLEDSYVSIAGVTANDSLLGFFAELVTDFSVQGSWFLGTHEDGGYTEWVNDLTIGTSNFDDATGIGLLVNHGANDDLSDDVANDSGISGFDVENLSASSLTGLVANGDGWNGLFLADCDGTTVVGSTFDDVVYSGNGTYVRASADVTFSGDAWVDNEYGVYDVGSHALTIRNSNASADEIGVVLLEDVDSELISNVVDNNTDVGVAFELSSNFVAESNTLFGDYEGIVGIDTLTGTLQGNSIVNATEFGILIEADTDSAIIDNSVANTFWGYELLVAQGTLLFANNVTNATEDGVVLEDDTGVDLSSGNVSDSAVGFSVVDSEGTNVTGNTFYNDTDDFDIQLEGLSETSVYWNNFVDGGGWEFFPADGTATSIVFDDGYPGGGNYWSNWTTPDVEHGPGQNLSGGDGIVDEPFEVSGSYEDHYPLTQALNVANLTIEFVAHGLPLGTTWGLEWNSVVTETTNGTSLSAFLGSPAWANYTYDIVAPAGWSASPAGGTIEYRGSLELVNVEFTAVTYTTTFQQSGLPTGTSWSVNVSGTLYSSTTGSLTVALANGSYDYAVTAIAGYVAAPPNGTVVVDNDTPTVAVTFTAVVYPVVFTETGLPSGTSWTVTLGSNSRTSTGSTLAIHVANGSYTYAVTNVSGYTVDPYAGFQNVRGPGASVAVVFTAVTSSSTPWLTWLLVALVVVLAIAVVLLLVRGRRKPAPTPAVTGWTPPPPGATSPPPSAGSTGGPPAGAVEPPAPPEWKET